MANLLERIVTTYEAAKEAWRRSAQEGEAAWSDVANRRGRYEFLWRFYENDIYDYLAAHKARYGLYRHIRPIYNPATRLVDFYVAKIWGGQLDWETMGGAIPIETDSDDLRKVIAQIWQWSGWQTKKNLAVRWGACLGDVAVKVVDTAAREDKKAKVYLQVMHPRMVKDAEFDNRGNVVSCVIEYIDSEPSEKHEGTYAAFTYKEVIDKEKFSTFKDDEPFDYYGYGVTWDNAYGFVPLVIANHKDCGLDWGHCCFHNGVETINEINDQASVFHDRMRKSNAPLWLVGGASRPREGNIDLSSDEATTTDQSRRQKENILYGDVGARADAMVSDVGMDQTIDNLEMLLNELERDFPELALHRMREEGMSGRALRIVYQDVSDRVIEARGNYDGALVRAQQMAVSVGGMRGLFPGFRLESYEAGDEEHRIGDRPVLSEALDYEALKLAAETGVPARRIWEKLGLGWTDVELDEMEAEAGGTEKPGSETKDLLDVAKEHLEAARRLTEGANE